MKTLSHAKVVRNQKKIKMVHFQGWLALSRNYYQPNLYAGQEAIVRTGHGTMDWLQTGKGVDQGFILSPC